MGPCNAAGASADLYVQLAAFRVPIAPGGLYFVCTSITYIVKMADAGFVYAPDRESEDRAECTYCNLALDGWEKGDDPKYPFISV